MLESIHAFFNLLNSLVIVGASLAAVAVPLVLMSNEMWKRKN